MNPDVENYLNALKLVKSVATKEIPNEINFLVQQGICGNTSSIFHLQYDDKEQATRILNAIYEDIIYKILPQWKHFTGDIRYPVPRSYYDKEKPRYAYVACRQNKWIDEYGQLRFELLDFLIEKMEKL